MKRFCKNLGSGLVIVGVALAMIGLLELGQAFIRASVNVPVYALGLDGIDLTAGGVVLLYAIIKTALDHRRERREAQIVTKLLDDTILEARARVQAIDAEPASVGRSRRRAMAQITVLALEEKRAALISGKIKRNGGKDNAGNSGKRETGVVGENPVR